jgi:hypothetical protein
MAAKRIFTFSSLMARLAISLLLVFATFNPSGYSIYHWLIAAGSAPISLKLVVLIAVAMIAYTIFRVVFAAFRWSGLIAASLAAAGAGLLVIPIAVPEPFESSESPILLTIEYVAPTALALVIAFGLSWSYLIERLTGQLQKRYVR